MTRRPPFSRTVRDAEQILERAADALLMMSVRERGYGDHPFHTVRWEVRTAARENGPREAYEFDPPTYERHPWADVARVLGARLALSAADRVMVACLARGSSPREVQEALGLPPQAVRCLLRRLARAVRRYGLTPDDLRPRRSDVEQAFREQITVTTYRAERHCPEGQEACRRHGKCTRRWYLRLSEG
jgi:hypothetical protein